MKYEDILYLLINSYVNYKTNEELADYLHCHRNTVSKYLNLFSNLKSQIIMLAEANDFLKNAEPDEFNKSLDAVTFIQQHLVRSKEYKCTDDTYFEIEKYCRQFLNYCIFDRDINEFANKMLNELARRLSKKYGKSLDLVKDHVINYYNYSFSTYEYDQLGFTSRKECVKYMRDISNIRNYNRIPKNYAEVYNTFQESNSYKALPISYNAFYKLARRFWGKKVFKYRLIDLFECRQ